MNSNEQFLNKDNEIIDVEPIPVQQEDSSADTGMGSLAAGVAGAVVGAVAAAVAGGLAAKATPDEAGDKIKDAAENVTDKVKDAAERAKPSNHQDAQDVEIRERIVIEPACDVVAETTLPSDKEHFPEGQIMPMEVYEETPDSEIEKPSFARKVDQLYQE
jgi:hypothetical protein